MSPYEEIETIADFLPEEGQSITLTRRKGQLVVDDVTQKNRQQDALTQERLRQAKQRVAEETLFGHLVQANERLQNFSIKNFLFAILLTYATSMGLSWYLGWESMNAGVVVGVTLTILAGFVLNERNEVKKRFVYQVCPELDRVLTERNIDKFHLLGMMKNHKDLAPLARAISRWTK